MLKTIIRRFSGRRMLKNRVYSKVYGFIVNKKLVNKKVRWIDSPGLNKKLIEKESTCKTIKPNIKIRDNEINTICPEIYLYKFEDVFGSINSSSFFNKEAIIENMFNVSKSIGKYNSGHLIKHDAMSAVVQLFDNKETISQPVFFLAGNGSSNYFHWTIEILPKLLYVKKSIQDNSLKVDKIIVSKSIEKNKSFKDAYTLISEYLDLNLQLVSYTNDIQLNFKEVYFITSFNCVLYNSKDNNDFSFYFRPESIKKIRDIILSSKDFKNIKEKNSNYKKFPKNIFIRRGVVSKFNKRNYNEDEVFSEFKKYGFEDIYIEDYSFIEQAFLFNNAESIAAPTGAVWTNIVFANTNLKAHSWISDKAKGFGVYSSLANLFNIDIKFMLGVPIDENLNGSYVINLKELELTLKESFNMP